MFAGICLDGDWEISLVILQGNTEGLEDECLQLPKSSDYIFISVESLILLKQFPKWYCVMCKVWSV